MSESFVASVLTLLLFQLAAAPQTGREPPDRPAERFTVFVYAADDAQVVGQETIGRVTEEVKNRIKARKKWFVMSSNREKAEVVVTILRHRVQAELIPTTELHARYHGTEVDIIDKDKLIEQHSIDARAEGPGFMSDMTGTVQRHKEAGTLRDAASDLARQLEETVKAHYWEAMDARSKIPDP